MGNKKAKWLMYTVLIGLIPVLSRLLVWLVTKGGSITPFVASDFIAYGLVLHVSNINEIEHINEESPSWKTIQNGISIIFIVTYGVLSTLGMLNEKASAFIDVEALKFCTIGLAVASTVLSYSVFDRLSAIAREEKV
ncbi:hypothetical protein [Undibacterium danionis]|uniref:Uncharacterized protein n=1 Tax=Undibacterium danionis TaxID=1812100 RepID=A0ABV6IER5_9BURK